MIGSALFDPVGTGLITVFAGIGPIVGDPEPIIAIAPGGYLTTGDLAIAESGEAGDLEAASIEMWVMSGQATPAAQSSLAAGPMGNTGVRQWEVFLNTDLTISFSARKSTGVTQTLTSAAALTGGIFAHVVCQARPPNLEIYINGALSTSAAWGAQFNILGATAGSEDMRVSKSTNGITPAIYFSDVAFYRLGLTPARVLAHFVAGKQRGYNQQASGERIGAVLDTAASQSPRRLNAGVRSVTPRYMSGQAPIDEISSAVQAEAVDAAFFCEADGTFVYLDSAHRASAPYNTVQATFGDAGGSELPYLDFQTDYSDTYIVNHWTATREGTAQQPGQTQEVSDTASIRAYDDQPRALTGIPVLADSDALAVATAMLAKYKDPFKRVTTIVPNMADPATAEAVYRLELMDRIRLLQTPPGGGARFDQTLFVQAIKFSGKPGAPPGCELSVSPL